MHGCRLAIAFGLLAGLATANAGTGQFLVQAWQTSEGLPHNAPTAVLQSADAYLWIATPSGLARFDGVRFETFNVASGLPDNRVLSIMQDRTGSLWIGTAKGLARRSGGRIDTLPNGWPDIAVWYLAEAGDGAVWVGTEREAWRSTAFQPPEAVTSPASHPGVRSLMADGPDGAMWILYRGALQRWENGDLSENTAFASLVRDRELFSLRRAPDGTLWVAGAGLLARGSPDGAEWREITEEMPNSEGIHILAQPAADGTLWVATRNRGLRFLRDGRWHLLGINEGLSHDDVRWITEDREGNLWIPTNGGGINRLSEQRLEVFGRGRGLGRQTTTALVRDRDGTVWAGTDGDGVLRLDGAQFMPGLPDDVMPDGFVWSMLAARDGSLWVGTFRHGVMRWKDGRADWLGLADGLVSNWVPCLMEDRRGRIWIGTDNGGLQMVENQRLVTHRGKAGDRGDPVVALHEDADGGIWVGTAGDGLHHIRDGQFTRHSKTEGLPGDLVNTLHADHHERLWIGTSEGLALRHPGGFHCWTTEDGLISNSIVQIQSDQDGHLWLGSDAGLQRIAVESGTAGPTRPAMVPVQAFSRPDGLPTPQFTGGHGTVTIREPGGALWFSLAAGAVRVDPAGMGAGSPQAGVHMVSLSAGGREFWHFERGGDEPIELPPGTGSLQIRFTSAALRTPEKLRFRHRIHGLHDDWQESSPDRSVAVGTLAPGTYRFEVMADSQEANHSTRTAAIRFRVRPYFWQTLAFRLAAGLAVAVVIVIAVRRWSLRRLQRKMIFLEKERHIDQERSRIARDLHDDLGASLTEINFLGTLGIAGAHSPVTRERLEGIVERAQQMAKSLDEIVWTVNPVNDTLSSTAYYLCSRTQESLNTAGIRCRLDIDEDLPAVQLDSERRHHLLMAVNEAVNNIMKHSAAAEARLSLHADGGMLHLVIEDHGIGFDPAAVPPGRNGLRNIRRRIEAAGGRCEIHSTPERGSRIIVALPILPGKAGQTRRPATH